MRISIGGQTVMRTDSVVQHGFTFTPAFSLLASDRAHRIEYTVALPRLDQLGHSGDCLSVSRVDGVCGWNTDQEVNEGGIDIAPHWSWSKAAKED